MKRNWIAKLLVGTLLACFGMFAHAQTTISLLTPHTLTVVDPRDTCGDYVTMAAYKTITTGFTVDGNYVLGMDDGTFECGNSGRGGGGIHYYNVCVTLQWDLTGALVSTSSVQGVCPKLDATKVFVLNGYTAETLVYKACGSKACYATYYYPMLITP